LSCTRASCSTRRDPSQNDSSADHFSHFGLSLRRTIGQALIDCNPVVVKHFAETTKHILVTGGVVSSLGKGLTAASLGNLLTARGLRVVMQKLDPYLNVDPGTMNPFQHGEVFVTDDGAETDLDIGHYERFLDIDLSQAANVTTGQIYSQVLPR